MRKFKLIRKYPGSPKLGTEVKKNNGDGNYSYVEPGIKEYCRNIIENNKEYWQEITKPCKDCEELMWTCSNCREITKPEYTILNCANKDNGYIHIYQSKQSNCLKSCEERGCKIHSVCRNSDSSIWTIGDNTQYGVIVDCIINKDNECLFLLKGTETRRPIQDLQRVKQPLFTTEDNIGANIGDYIYLVDNQYTITEFLLESGMIINAGKLFAIEENAKNYILLNKPCLSINDVKSQFKTLLSYSTKMIIQKLEELVKQKLKQ